MAEQEPRWLRAALVGHRDHDGGPRQLRIELATPDGLTTVASLDTDSALALARDLVAKVIEAGR
jgi:hypothetical protein